MEILRGVGLQRAVETASAKEFEQNGAIVAVESLTGRELHYFYRSYNDGVEGLSPTSRLFITQVGLEPLLRDRAQELGAEHHFATEFVGFEQDDEGVTSVIRSRDGGAEQTVRSQYLVAADGAHSAVRERLGIDMLGRADFADCVTIYFKANIREILGDRNLSVVYVNNPEVLGFFRFSFTGDSGFLVVFATVSPDGSLDRRVGEKIDTERCADLVRTALGARQDLPIEIENVQRWSASAACAARLRDRRVFLAGDAAHVMPPTGGFGGNTGIADAHNLAWKLAMVHGGAAGPRLLDTYDAERRPLDHLIVEQAYTRYVLRVDSSLPADDLKEQLDDAAIELGGVYRSAGVLDPRTPGTATTDTEDDQHDQDDQDAGYAGRGASLEDPRNPTGRPGTRAPHLPLVRDGTTISTHDLFQDGFALLTGADGHPWRDAAGRVARSLQVPLRAHFLAPAGEPGSPGALVDRDGRFADAFGTGSGGAVIVRPDGVIGWRAATLADDPQGTIEDAMTRLLLR
jgi:2-polyprenyl-6-methoxyphenol hydroxylase-like FAD-dependent oxidoreductase